MRKIVINGPCKLGGEVEISGAKNAVVAILPAAVMVRGKCTVENVPKISDVNNILEVLRYIGATIEYKDSKTLEIDCTNIECKEIPYELASRFRASYYFIGAMLARFGKATVAMPGGCTIGNRPIDLHIMGFEELGAAVRLEKGNIYVEAQGGLQGTKIYFDTVSVGATINVMLAAVTAQGLTIIENPAKEPHIVDVANFLNAMGANIKGAGTDVIKVYGVEQLSSGSYAAIPDQIEAGTFMVAAAATRGDVTVKNVIPKHLECITRELLEMGVNVEENDDSVRVSCEGDTVGISVTTRPYPGFPTDMQSQIAVLMALSKGSSRIRETIFESRFGYTNELVRMGANIKVNDRIATIEGVDRLQGAPVRARDLRAGAAMIIAGLVAEGETAIEEIEFIERGYENIIEKFRSLGADIRITER